MENATYKQGFLGCIVDDLHAAHSRKSIESRELSISYEVSENGETEPLRKHGSEKANGPQPANSLITGH
jgi:hypothetical protein